MEKKRRLNDATPEEWTAAFYNNMRLESEKRKRDMENLEKGLNGMSYEDFADTKHEWDDWKPNRDLG